MVLSRYRLQGHCISSPLGLTWQLADIHPASSGTVDVQIFLFPNYDNFIALSSPVLHSFSPYKLSGFIPTKSTCFHLPYHVVSHFSLLRVLA
jgi:hypothetical protein